MNVIPVSCEQTLKQLTNSAPDMHSHFQLKLFTLLFVETVPQFKLVTKNVVMVLVCVPVSSSTKKLLNFCSFALHVAS